MNDELGPKFESVTAEIYAGCHERAPNFGVGLDRLRSSLRKSLDKYLISAPAEPVTDAKMREFLAAIQADDLFMALACADGNERAWWEFDHSNRSYMERIARHLAKTDIDADEVIDWVYGELYGTRVVDGERMSKFATYSGRGSMRGWLRTVIWHAIVDLHRASHNEVSLDEMTETVGEGATHSNFAKAPADSEEAMIDRLTTDRYRTATVSSLSKAFSSLDNHERLLLCYYHVDRLKLREISHLAGDESSPLRSWFQRKSETRERDPSTRVHESTVMRWLEKSYAKVLQTFRGELVNVYSLTNDEIDICLDLATQDLAGSDLYRSLRSSDS